MPRRNPPSSLAVLPFSIPTPPRGAPKYRLPTPPRPLIIASPYAKRPSTFFGDLIPAPAAITPNSDSGGDYQAPWLRSKGFSEEEKARITSNITRLDRAVLISR